LGGPPVDEAAAKKSKLKKQPLQDKLVSKKGVESENIVLETIERQGIEEGDEEEEEEEEEVVMSADEMQEKCCEKFLEMFLIGSESTFLDSIDLILMMKCMPVKFVEYSIPNVKLYQLNILQQSIIAYLNED
jgi:hypothetical protein